MHIVCACSAMNVDARSVCQECFVCRCMVCAAFSAMDINAHCVSSVMWMYMISLYASSTIDLGKISSFTLQVSCVWCKSMASWWPPLSASISNGSFFPWCFYVCFCHLYNSSFGKVDGNIISYLLWNERRRFGKRWVRWGRGTRQQEQDIIVGSEYGHRTW